MFEKFDKNKNNQFSSASAKPVRHASACRVIPPRNIIEFDMLGSHDKLKHIGLPN
jgi:hypothetical protein